MWRVAVRVYFGLFRDLASCAFGLIAQFAPVESRLFVLRRGVRISPVSRIRDSHFPDVVAIMRANRKARF